jgi:DNA-binding response OmpR family regulator
VRHVVERHGGCISVASEGVGRGAIFSLDLPLAGDAAPGAEAVTEGSSPGNANAVADILVVDDEVDSAEALTLGLRIRGCDVRAAFDVRGALAAIATRRPRILVSDLTMPDMDGFELVRRIRAEEQDDKMPRIRAFAITGRGTPSDRGRARRAGFDQYMTKPVRVQELYQRIIDSMTNSAVAQDSPLAVWVLGAAPDVVEAIRQSGHEVQMVPSITAALLEPDRVVPPALIVDLDAAEGDVERFIHVLRENRMSLFVVALTCRPEAEVDRELYDRVLQKPVRPEDLARALKQAQVSA